MSVFQRVQYTQTTAGLGHSHITDLQIADIGGAVRLFSTTRYDGALQSWSIGAAGHSLIDTQAYEDVLIPGVQSTLTVLDGDDPLVLTGGGAGGALQTIAVDAAGDLAPETTLAGLPASFAGLQATTVFTQSNGNIVVFGGLAQDAGLAQLTFSQAGALLDHTTSTAPMTADPSRITATEAVAVGGQDFVFTAHSTENAITGWTIAANGDVTAVTYMDDADGLWVSAPTVMKSVQINGVTYLLLGAAGSSTISVMEVGTDGSLTLRDHVIDSRDSRFAGITTLDVITHDGRTYVLAGGADDGLSIFVLVEGGYLVAPAHVADTVDMGLDNVSAATLRSRGNGLDVFAASSSEAGLTQLRFDTGTAGATLTALLAGGLLQGTAGNDILQGVAGEDQIDAGAGDDILRDGGGADILTGGAGADVFILSADDETDIITDFTVGEDRLDLSLWPLLRDKSQLTFSLRDYGMDIVYGDERLIVQSADNTFIDFRLLTNSELIGDVTRLQSNIEPGYPGPLTPPPDTGQPVPPDPAGTNAAFDLYDNLSIATGATFADLEAAIDGRANATGRGNQALLFEGGKRQDVLIAGADTNVILAGAGDDTAYGGVGADLILGRGGDDFLRGQADGDHIFGGTGRDVIEGGAGRDTLRGGSGQDTLTGGAGNDDLFGDAGADHFIFDGGQDRIHDYEQGFDQITLDASVWRGLTSVADVLFLYGSIDGQRATIDLGEGDILIIDGVLDYSTFEQDIALF